MQRTALVGKKRGDEAIEVTLFLTTISTTCGAINVPAPLKGFYMVVNRDMA
jgi:hypothetical protein